MKIYILEGTVGQWSDKYTFKISAHLTRESAEERLKFYEKFLPPYPCSDATFKACCYELTKLGVMFGWEDEYDYCDIPHFNIDEVELEDTWK